MNLWRGRRKWQLRESAHKVKISKRAFDLSWRKGTLFSKGNKRIFHSDISIRLRKNRKVGSSSLPRQIIFCLLFLKIKAETAILSFDLNQISWKAQYSGTTIELKISTLCAAIFNNFLGFCQWKKLFLLTIWSGSVLQGWFAMVGLSWALAPSASPTLALCLSSPA